MTNNDILRKLRYIENWSDADCIALCALGGFKTQREQVCNWLKRDEDPEYEWITDKQLAHLLNGFIIQKRGSRDGEIPVAEDRLSNNAILRKLRIAYSFTDEHIVNVLQAANLRISKSEINALFRAESHPKFVVCQDQLLRKFLQGLQK